MKKQTENKADIKKDKTHQVKKSAVYAAVGLVLLVLTAIIFFIVVPDVKRVYEKKDELEKKKILYKQDQQNAAKAHEYSKLIEGIQRDKGLLDLAIIKKEQEVEFIQLVEKVSQIAGGEIEITHFTPAKKKNAPTLKIPGQTESEDELLEQQQEEEIEKQSVYLSVKFIGNYQEFLSFYYRLENMSYLFKINSIEIDKFVVSRGLTSEKETPPGQIEATVVISFIPK